MHISREWSVFQCWAPAEEAFTLKKSLLTKIGTICIRRSIEGRKKKNVESFGFLAGKSEKLIWVQTEAALVEGWLSFTSLFILLGGCTCTHTRVQTHACTHTWAHTDTCTHTHRVSLSYREKKIPSTS